MLQCVTFPSCHNGYSKPSKIFDSNFTFYRGAARSQIDLAITNDILGIKNLR